MQNIKEYIVTQCRNEFLKDPKTNCRLLKIKESTAELYEVGIVPETGLISMLESAGYSGNEIKALNILSFSSRYCFPARNSDGDISAFYFKRSTTSDRQPIWSLRTYDKNSLYGMNNVVSDKDYILLCESVSDVLACANFGINAVALQNSHLLNKEQSAFVSQFKTVFLAFDNDDYGMEKSEKAKTHLAEAGVAAIVLSYESIDICEAMRDLTQRRLIINQIKSTVTK